MAKVTFKDVLKIYDDDSGGTLAVKDLNLDVKDGEFLVVVGPSGSGKSTTLRMLAGLESITDGEIRIGDEVVNELPPRKRDIALVFQSNALYPHKSVRGNMGYGLRLRTSLSDEEINERVEEAAEMMGIEELLDKKPASLSGGQQQRVATGRAIVREPAVFLFDEPLSDLDANLRKHMRTELARIHSELEITSLYVTHDQEEAMTLADRIAIMNHGELQQVGRPTDVYHNPTNVFVADFIGSPNINLFDVEYDRHSSGATLRGETFTYELSEDIAQSIASEDGDALTLGIRPENLEVDADGEIESTVEVVETVGSDNFLYVRVAGQECRVRTSSTLIPDEGETLHLTFDEDDIYLFDSETEERVLDRSERYEERRELLH
ncbi:MAG: ABC transporter ATP-binding protein [Haloplanus sp.]